MITASSLADQDDLQHITDYIKYLEATENSKAKQSDINKLADEVNSKWWQANKSRFIKDNQTGG